MKTQRTYPLARIAAALALSVAAALGSTVAGAAAWRATSSDGCAGTYGWPVKPFDRRHQIRGSFGDPRTRFDGPPTAQTLLTGNGSFSFHQGVDITAPDGTAVYPVAPGTVFRVTREWVGVSCGNGRSFEYWHLNARVRVGQRVEAGRTVLGVIQRGEAHVHLTHREGRRVVNPLAPGRLSPYEDTTTPDVLSIAVRRSGHADAELPQLVSGRVDLVAEAVDFAEPIDTPGLRTPSVYRNWIVTPARLTWRLERWNGRIVVPERIARDVRRFVPPNDRFWSSFARGTHQNQSVFGLHYSYLQPGRYFFKLSAQSLDTRTLRDGVYDLVVTATDVAGHRAVGRLRFTVDNKA